MTRSRTLVTATTALLALVAAACGSDDSTGSTDAAGGSARTVEIEMRDNKYVPDTVSVEDGETVHFVFTNMGSTTHDAFIGDERAQDDHEMEMRDDMGGHGGAGPDVLTVEPGKTGGLTHTFTAADQVLVGCHEPGHYEAGMHLTIEVS